MRTEYSCQDSIVKVNVINVFPVPNPAYTFQVVKFGIYDFKQNATGGVAPFLESFTDNADFPPVVCAAADVIEVQLVD